MPLLNKLTDTVKSRNFWLNLGLFLLSIVVAFLILIFFLQRYTRHGESITVPKFIGLTEAKVKELCEEKGLRYEIAEKKFEASKPVNTVLSQNPDEGSKVKEGRKIYLTINDSKAPEVPLPGENEISGNPPLEDFKNLLKTMGFEVGQIIIRPDIAENAVLEMQQNGRKLVPGSKLPKGSQIDLVVGDGGKGSVKVPVPDLRGLEFEQAIEAIRLSNFVVGKVINNGVISDSTRITVSGQFPDPSSNQPTGSAINIYIKQKQ